MSDVAPQPQPATGGNMFTNKYGPLPGWAWLLIVGAAAYLYMKRKSATTASTSTTSSAGTGTNNALTSNLVGVQEPVPTLAGTYTISVQPAQAQYSNTTSTSTQGVSGAGQNVPASSLDTSGTPATNPAVNVGS